MPYARALRWLADARGPEAWGYLPGGTARPEPTVWACAAGAEAPLEWLGSTDLSWALLPAPAALSQTPGSEALRERLLDAIVTRSGETVEGMPHLDGMIPGWSWFDGTFSWVEPTCFAVISLVRGGRGAHARADEGRALIRDRVCADGGWNYGNYEVLGAKLPSYQHSSGWGLLALPPGDPLAAAGLERLALILKTPSTRSLAVASLAAAHHGTDPGPWLDALRARQADDGSFGYGRVDRTALAAVALRLEAEGASPLTGQVSWPTTEEEKDG